MAAAQACDVTVLKAVWMLAAAALQRMHRVNKINMYGCEWWSLPKAVGAASALRGKREAV